MEGLSNAFPNRDVEKQILQRLLESYPKQVNVQGWKGEFPTLDKEINYLDAHGLIVGLVSKEIGGSKKAIAATLTEKGIDFLADDGGLSAILGVVTVKLHADTIKDLLAKEINHSTLPPEDKKRFLDRLRELPAESTKHLVNTLVAEGAKAGLQHASSASQWLHTLFQSL